MKFYILTYKILVLYVRKSLTLCLFITQYSDLFQAVRGVTASGSGPTSFKDLVQKRAEEYGILFVPHTGKFREAKQIYRFGDMQIYFDRNVVFLVEPLTQKWVPVSLNSLIDRAK